MIALVDYGMGNLRSVRNALRAVGTEVHVVNAPAELGEAQGIIVPGVGAFADGMANLRKAGMVEALKVQVMEMKKPYLGICLGMQFLAELSLEGGETPGLDLVPGRVERLSPDDKERYKVPHMGWNDIQVKRSCPLFRDIEERPVFYFVHGYHFQAQPDSVSATCWHGQDVVAAVWKEIVFGVQFHPEKSQGMGLKVLENFCRFVERGHA